MILGRGEDSPEAGAGFSNSERDGMAANHKPHQRLTKVTPLDFVMIGSRLEVYRIQGLNKGVFTRRHTITM